MKSLIFGLAATAVGLTLSATPASAQWHRNVVNNSGNGVGNAVVVGNQPGLGFPGFPVFPGPSSNQVFNSGNGIGNRIVVGNGGVPYFPPPFPGGGFLGGGFPGGSIGGSFPGGPVFPGGVNINVVTNSGNGVGNRIVTGNGGQPGGLNINVVTNSGNGVGNRVIVGNR